MKLYNANLSPFASRCRIQLYAKGLDVELVDPPGGLSSDAYKAINPTGKVPALEVDGAVLPESDAICEYIEDCFPEPALRPTDPIARARMRAIMRIADSYVLPPLQALFSQRDPTTRDAAVVSAKLEELTRGYDWLETFVSGTPAPYAAGAELTLADGTLVPLFFFATRLHPVLGDKSPVESRPSLAAWWDAVLRHAAVAKVNAELEKALAEFLAAGN